VAKTRSDFAYGVLEPKNTGTKQKIASNRTPALEFL
jgi:hypothetical protein